jgi:hypothetical protein
MSEVAYIQQIVALAILSFAFFALAPQGKTSVAKSSLINNSHTTRQDERSKVKPDQQ